MDKPKPLFRSLFFSDLHLGLEESRPKLLNRFLKVHKAANLYLVGDIVDTWQLRRSWYWPNACLMSMDKPQMGCAPACWASCRSTVSRGE